MFNPPFRGGGGVPSAHATSHESGGEDEIRDATSAQNGLATAIQISKLDAIESAANNYTLPPTLVEISSFMNCIVLDEVDFSIVVSGGQIYLDLEKDGGGDFDVQFNEAIFSINCTTGAGAGGKARVQLIKGADENTLQRNYVYIDHNAGVPALVSGGAYPAVTFAWIGVVSVFDDVTTNANGAFGLQRYNDAVSHDGCGHLKDICERVRKTPAYWESGCATTLTITPNGAGLDGAQVDIASGLAYQLHLQTITSFFAGGDMYCVNHPSEPFKKITDLNELTVDSEGDSLLSNNRSWGLSIMMVQNSNGFADDRVLVFLPTHYYTNDQDCIDDVTGYNANAVPDYLRTTTFRIARVCLKYTAVSGGTLTNLIGGAAVQDQRGFLTAGGSSSGSGTTDHAGLSNLDFSSSGHSGFASSTATSEVRNALGVLALQTATDRSYSIFNMSDGFADTFVDETGVNAGSSTNENYDSPVAEAYANYTHLAENIALSKLSTGDVGLQQPTQERLLQSLTTTEPTSFDGVKLHMYRAGNPAGDFKVELFVKDAVLNEPTGSALATVTTNFSTIATPTAGAEYEFTFSSPAIVTAGEYCIVIDDYASGTSAGNTLIVRLASAYTGGSHARYNSGTVTWTQQAQDLWIEPVTSANTANMSLVSARGILSFSPALGRVVFVAMPKDAATLNTDIKAYLSSDGSTWNLATLSLAGLFDDESNIYATAEVALTGAATDSIYWKIETLNTKAFVVEGVYFYGGS